MNDWFALLDLPRSPWLDSEVVQRRFIEKSGAVHPDRVHNASPEEKALATARFAALNGACQVLRNSRQRLRHFLELEKGEPVAQQERLPSDAAEFYFKLGALCKKIDAFLSAEIPGEAISPLLQFQRFQRAQGYRDEVEKLRGELDAKRRALEDEVCSLSGNWPGARSGNANAPCAQAASVTPPEMLARLEEIYRELSYVVRWIDQLRERTVRLVV